MNHINVKHLVRLYDVRNIKIAISGINLNQLIKRVSLIHKNHQSKLILVRIQQMARDNQQLNVHNIIVDGAKLRF